MTTQEPVLLHGVNFMVVVMQKSRIYNRGVKMKIKQVLAIIALNILTVVGAFLAIISII